MPLHFPRLYSRSNPLKTRHSHHHGESEGKEAKQTEKRETIGTRTLGDSRRKNQGLPILQTLTTGEDESNAESASEEDDDKEVYHTPMTEPGQIPSLRDPLPPHELQNDLDASDGPRKTPFAHPLLQCQPQPRPGLTTDQAAKYAAIHAEVSKWIATPPKGPNGSSIEPLSEDEQMWLTRECLLRYLRAANWTTSHSTKRLLDTLLWRREFGTTDITAESMSREAETGKMVILGYDNSARPCLYMSPGRQNTEKSEDQIRHLVFLLERAIDMMDTGQETTALLINFRGATSGGSPSVGQGKQVLGILQGHYPERLGRACISELPWYINTFFKLVSPFIDPVTREKMIFNDDLRKHIPPEQLDKDFGGDCDFVYEHERYWPTLNKLCTDRRAAYRQRWVEGGKLIGEYEGYLKGGKQACLRDQTQGSDAVPVDSHDNSQIPPRKVGE